jgi:hypothetical protein
LSGSDTGSASILRGRAAATGRAACPVRSGALGSGRRRLSPGGAGSSPRGPSYPPPRTAPLDGRVDGRKGPRRPGRPGLRVDAIQDEANEGPCVDAIRDLIGQAKGIHINREGVTAEQAFETLRERPST